MKSHKVGTIRRGWSSVSDDLELWACMESTWDVEDVLLVIVSRIEQADQITVNTDEIDWEAVDLEYEALCLYAEEGALV